MPPGPAAPLDLARALLRRWGVVFRRILEREAHPAPWRDIARALRSLEDRGDVRGGRFVAGFTGEQFALPEAVGLLRSIRRQPPAGGLVRVSAADPLNLAGILTPGERVVSLARNRILLRDGLPIAALEAGKLRRLEDGPEREADLEQALVRGPGKPAGARVGFRSAAGAPRRSMRPPPGGRS